MQRLARFALVAAFFMAAPAHADLGQPDPSFGTSGVVTEPAPCTDSTCTFIVSRVLPQPDGKVLVLSIDGRNGGFHGQPYAVTTRLTRRNADGSPDLAFGGSGSIAVFTSTQGGADFVQPDGALALQPDGKIVVAARLDFLRGSDSSCPSCRGNVGVARLLPDGSYDDTFGTGSFGPGRVITSATTKVVGVGVQSDGKIIVGYRAGSYALLRLDTQGVGDPVYHRPVVPGVDPVNPFLVSGFVMNPAGHAWVSVSGGAGPVSVASFTSAGQLDQGFNGTGSASYAIPNGKARSLARDVVDGLYLAGADAAGSVMTRITPLGTIDPNWGVRAYSDGAAIESLALDFQGRVVGAGSIASNVALRRWTVFGHDDPSLPGPGRVMTTLAGTATSVSLLPNSKAIVLFGNSIARLGANALQDNREFVLQQYRDFLGREGEAGGVSFWTAELTAGRMTRAQVAERFLTSTEFQSFIAPIARLYLAYFLRYPDYPGLSFWLNVSRARNSLDSISEQFASGAEFNVRYGSLDNSQFVERVYSNVLGRSPDAQGFAFWVNQLDSGARTRGQVMLAFSEGAEFRALSQNEVYVTMIYSGMLRREPDAGGFAFWVDYMDQGNSSLALIQGFLDGPEYRARFAP